MKRIVMGLLCLMVAEGAWAAEVRVISGGAVEPGLEAFARLVRRDLGHDLRILYNTAPQMARRLAAGEVFDIVIAPPATLGPVQKEGRIVPETRVTVGRVGAGVVVRAGAEVPDVATVEALRRALLEADSVVYNRASTGIYLDKLFAGLGLAEALKGKTTRYATGAEVLEHVIGGRGREIGFGAMTEIRLYEPRGIRLVGPLPAAVQNHTVYEAALMQGAPAEEAARAVLRHLAVPAAKAAFASGGVE